MLHSKDHDDMSYLADDKWLPGSRPDPFRNDEEKMDWILRRLDDPTHPLPDAGGESGAQTFDIADSSPADAERAAARRPTGRNNRQIGSSFDKSAWQPLGGVNDQRSAGSFTAGHTIGIEVSSVAFPPTNQFRITVLAIPLDRDGSPQTTMSAREWTAPVSYSSGFTGLSRNQLVIQADPPIGSLYRWTVSTPPQQSAHDNAASNMVEVYALR